MRLKRVISAALAVSMAVSMVPATAVTAFAADAGNTVAVQTVEGEDDENTAQVVSVTVDSFETGKLKEAVEAAAKAKGVEVANITSLTISGGTLNATDFEYLSSVTVDNAGNATYQSNAGLKSLIELDLTGASCVKNEIPEHAFQNNVKIQTVILPENLEVIGRSAFNCVPAKSGNLSYVGTREGKESNTIIFPKNLKKIGQSAFWGDDKLTGKLVLPENLEILGTNAFDNTKVTGEITIKGNVVFETAADGNEHNGTFRGTNITAITFKEGIKKIPANFASNCPELASVTIPESVSEIEGYAFFKAGKVKNFIVPGTDVTVHYGALHDENQGQYNIYFKTSQERIDPSNNYNKWGDKAVILNTNGGEVNTEKSEYGLFIPEKAGYTFKGWTCTDADGKLKTVSSENDVVAGKTYTASWELTPVAATMTATTSKSAYLVNTPVDVNVTINPGTHEAEIFNGNVALTYGDEVEKVELNGKELTKKEYTVQELAQLMGLASQSSDIKATLSDIKATLKVTYKKTGSYTFGVALNDADGETICNADATVAVGEKAAEIVPATKLYDLTIKNADATIKNGDEELKAEKNDKGELIAKVPENADVTVTYTSQSDAVAFEQWTVTTDKELDVDVKTNPLTFKMPAGGVTVEAMTKDASIEEEPNVLGTAAVIGTAAVGTAVLAWQGYELGTELYLKYALPAGAAIPTNRAELAELVWSNAGKPEPVAVLPADAAETEKAIAWAVENDLLKATKDNGEAYEETDSVSKLEVIQAWNKAQEMNK